MGWVEWNGWDGMGSDGTYAAVAKLLAGIGRVRMGWDEMEQDGVG